MRDVAQRAAQRPLSGRVDLVVTTLVAVILASGVELVWRSFKGESNDWAPVVAATLTLAAAAAAFALVASVLLPRFLAATVALLPPLWLFARNGLSSLQGHGQAWLDQPSVFRIVCLLIAGVGALGAAWILRRRAGQIALGALAVVLLASALVLVRDGSRSASYGERGSLPDVVLIILDTTRRDRLSLYGHDRPTTPNLDRFAAAAQVYEDAWSVSPWTAPSHASLFTGMLPAGPPGPAGSARKTGWSSQPS